MLVRIFQPLYVLIYLVRDYDRGLDVVRVMGVHERQRQN